MKRVLLQFCLILTCMRRIILIAHNVRSCHNIGSLLRTAEGLGVEKVYLTGYSPYPTETHDERLPHLAQKINKQIHKTALDAETLQDWHHEPDIFGVMTSLKASGFTIVGIEQHALSLALPDYQPPNKIALVVGNEINGIEPKVAAHCDKLVEIPMFGKKESFNVAQAAAIALYHTTFAR